MMLKWGDERHPPHVNIYAAVLFVAIKIDERLLRITKARERERN